MFFWWKLSFHLSITELCKSKFSTKAIVIEGHRLCTITIKEKKRSTT